MPKLLHDLLIRQASLQPGQTALVDGPRELSYGDLAEMARQFAEGLLRAGIEPGDRVGIYLEKRIETVAAIFGAVAAGACFVPLNPLYQARHVAHILDDCGARFLVTSASRFGALESAIPNCRGLRNVILIEESAPAVEAAIEVSCWRAFLEHPSAGGPLGHRRIDEDVAAIFYTSGSTGMPKGVVLSHRNLVVGAQSVCEYLANTPEDRILAALPLSFDAGFSQLTTGFLAGATVVLLNYLLPRDVINAIMRHNITGLTGVPPLFNQLVQVPWPKGTGQSLRYIASTGGAMPAQTLGRLRRAPRAEGARYAFFTAPDSSGPNSQGLLQQWAWWRTRLGPNRR